MICIDRNSLSVSIMSTSRQAWDRIPLFFDLVLATNWHGDTFDRFIVPLLNNTRYFKLSLPPRSSGTCLIYSFISFFRIPWILSIGMYSSFPFSFFDIAVLTPLREIEKTRNAYHSQFNVCCFPVNFFVSSYRISLERIFQISIRDCL